MDTKPHFIKQGQALVFIHLCHCGAWGSFGYEVNLLRAIKTKNPYQAGKWFCKEHRPLP